MIDSLLAGLREKAHALGLDAVGVCSPDPSQHMVMYREWLRAGYHGEMRYLARSDAVARRGGLPLTMAEVRSVVVVAQGYFQEDAPGIPEDPSRGVVARYARGEDYHDVLKSRLQDLLVWLQGEARRWGLAERVRGFPYVDTGPILERDLGRRAGLGWFGRNTMLIHPRRGSYFFLGVLLTDLELTPSEPFRADHCGSCRACLDACPTGALLGRNERGAPMMDARLCISYLTIELRGPIPRALRPRIGNRIFGCDICQEACPWNVKFAETSMEPGYRSGPDTEGPALVELMGLTEEGFRTRFSGSPILRAKRAGFLRNVAVALGNWLDSVEHPPEDAIAVLVAACSDPEPMVRGHAAWALGRVGTVSAMLALGRQAEVEVDAWVAEEISAALGR